MERPNIPPDSTERLFLQTSNYVFSVVFATEMFVKVSIFENSSGFEINYITRIILIHIPA